MSTHTQRQQTGTLEQYMEYHKLRPLYLQLCEEAERQLKRQLQGMGVPFSATASRVKSFPSMLAKINKGNLHVAPGQFMSSLSDTAGVRIVIWQPSDRETVAKGIYHIFKDAIKIKENVEYDSGYSDDKYLCCLHKPAKFSSIRFELQVQTAMMNAWASVEHDISYKGGIQIPPNTATRFTLLANVTTLLDSNMDTLTQDTVEYAKQLSKDRLNVFGLKDHLNRLVERVDIRRKITRDFADPADAQIIVEELLKCNIAKLDNLEKLITEGSIKECIRAAGSVVLNYSGLVRLILLHKKLSLYFEVVMPEFIPLEKDWLVILKSLQIDYRRAARDAGKDIYVQTKNGIEPIDAVDPN